MPDFSNVRREERSAPLWVNAPDTNGMDRTGRRGRNSMVTSLKKCLVCRREEGEDIH